MNLLPYKQNNKFVFCDSLGNQKITQVFDYAQPFKFKFSIVANKDLYGVINESGKIIVPLKYRKIYYGFADIMKTANNSEGIFFSINNDSIAYSHEGKLITKIPEEELSIIGPDYDYPDIIKINGLYGLVSSSDTLIKPMYQNLYFLNWGSASLCAKINDSYGIINSRNEILIPFEYENISWLDDKYLYKLTKKDAQTSCYYISNSIKAKTNSLFCYPKLIKHHYEGFLFVEDQTGLQFYVSVENGKELKK